MKLFQKARTGKTKWIELYTEGNLLCSKWGLLDSDKIQETKKECVAMNIGKANETTPEQQAIIEMEAKIKKKMENGYVEDVNTTEETIPKCDIDLNNIPKSFCPSKPAKDAPTSILKSPDTFGQLKRNGHCVILCKTNEKRSIYSRGMEDKTEHLCLIPVIQDMLNSMKEGTLLITEFCFVNNNGKDSPRNSAKVARKQDTVEALEAYNQLLSLGHFEIVPLDLMFTDYKFIGNTDYLSVRYEEMKKQNLPNILPIIPNWKEYFEEHKNLKDIEGLVLRTKGEASHIRYTLNGKADKCGAWKLKYVYEDDFIVIRAEKGKAGKQAGMYAQYYLAQYNSQGELVEYGKCGPGKLNHERLAELTQEIDSGLLKFPFVIEVEFQSRQEDSGCCEFPQFTRVRYDKNPKDCLFDLE